MKKIILIFGIIIFSIALIYGIKVCAYSFLYRDSGVEIVDKSTIEYKNAIYRLVEFDIGRDLKEDDILIYERPPFLFMTGYQQIFIDDDERFLYETTFGSKNYKDNLSISQYLDRIYVREDIDITKELFIIPDKECEFYLFDEIVNIDDTEVGKFMHNNFESLNSMYPLEEKICLKINQDIYLHTYSIDEYNGEYYIISYGMFYEMSDKMRGFFTFELKNNIPKPKAN